MKILRLIKVRPGSDGCDRSVEECLFYVISMQSDLFGAGKLRASVVQ